MWVLEKDDHLRNQMLSATTTLGREREPQRAPSAIFAPDVMEPTGPQSVMTPPRAPRRPHQQFPIREQEQQASWTKTRRTGGGGGARRAATRMTSTAEELLIDSGVLKDLGRSADVSP